MSPSDRCLPPLFPILLRLCPLLERLKRNQVNRSRMSPCEEGFPLMLYPDSRVQEPTKFDNLNEPTSHARIPMSPASRPPEGSPMENRRHQPTTGHLQGIQGNDGRAIPSIHISEGSRRIDASKRRERRDGPIQAGRTMPKYLESSQPSTTDPSNGLMMDHQSTGRTRSPRPLGRQEPSPYSPPDVANGSRKPDRSPKSPLLSVPSPTPQTSLSDDVSGGSPSRRPAAKPRSREKLFASQPPGEKMEILSREKRSTEDSQSNVHTGESQLAESPRLARTNKTVVVNDKSTRADTSPPMKRTAMFRPHQLYPKDTPLEDDIVKRMSLLRRITTSPNPQTLPRPRLAKDLSQYAPAYVFAAGGNPLPSDNPLFLTLDDALSKPYDPSSLVHMSQYARQSWAEAQDATEQIWTPVEEPNQQVPHDSFDSSYRTFVLEKIEIPRPLQCLP
ncbi:hypothetical protein BS47DRAFT_480785 [Hydnum rufescens UP504]|uniref:Uncharacterized protein n=1 Tax=Hydnum rufescens UP504 TaxID=1448309 RepID=A0A9P6AHN9_9AGAM|nr:hypothetical protein BS47DRAFT_480785 [Hydnum rufescens UP504]